MANPEHVAILKQGVEAWNKWRSDHPEVAPDLTHADLSGSDLSGIDLRAASLQDAALFQTKLVNADLSAATLHRAHFTFGDLSGTKFVGADVAAVIFDGTRLEGTDFTGAHFWGNVFANLSLAGVKGLGQAYHGGPSSIGVETLLYSKDAIPAGFLAELGVPTAFVEYVASLAGRPLDYCSCFISYSTKDQEFAQCLHADLQGKGVRCWFAPEDLKIGDKFRVAIDETIRVYDKLLLVLSEHSVQSDWVEKEVETAMEKEREQKRTMLFPIRLDDAVMEIKTGWPADIRRTRHIGDFTHWTNHDAYQKAFARLLRDLKADSATHKP